MKTLTGFAWALVAPLALAHEGHGLASPHWHATDTLGFVLLGAVVAAALWASRRK
jgi:hypothetical protein